MAVLNDKEVIAHLDLQVFVNIDWNKLLVAYENENMLDIQWRVVLTTSESFYAFWYNKKANSVVRRVPQNHETT